MNKVLLVHSEQYKNWVFDQHHPTQGRRYILAVELLPKRLNQLTGVELQITEPVAATWEQLAQVHDLGYLDQVINHGQSHEWSGNRADLAELAVLFAGGTITALDALLKGKIKVAVNFAGAKHHAQFDRSSGFCVFADFAMAALIATKQGHKVAIFDLDAHHGDGTENLLRNHPVLTYSVHDRTIFPGTGFITEPELLVYNKPLAAESGDLELADAASEFNQLAAAFGATMIFIAAGADGHELDPLSTLNYSTAGIAAAVAAIRARFPLVPILIGGAGGYRPDDTTPEVWVEAVIAAIGLAPVAERKYYDLNQVDFDNDAEIDAVAKAIIASMSKSKPVTDKEE